MVSSFFAQEVIPTSDGSTAQDLVLEIADKDQQAGVNDMQGEQGDEAIADIMGKVYRVQPFGLACQHARTRFK